MTIHNDVQQGTPEWMTLRIGRFGGTDAQTLQANGKGLETACYQKAAERLTGKKESTYTNPDMERGVELESMARNYYSIETGNEVTEVGYISLDEFTGCSPDGLIGYHGVLEIKCPNDVNFLMAVHAGKYDKKYYWQCQHNMFVSDRLFAHLVFFNESLDKIHVIDIQRNDEDIEKIKAGISAGVDLIKQIEKSVRG